jgi:hypothetical protein
MAQRDAEHSSVGGERRCLLEHLHGPACRPPRGMGEPVGERGLAAQRPEPASADDEAPDAGEAIGAGGSNCRADRPGWAGAHRHGGVRPRPPAVRGLRPPRRWC